MLIRARAPLRLGLAGGGTDISPYCDSFGGAVLNATIDLYAYCTIEPTTDGRVSFYAADLDLHYECGPVERIEEFETLPLHTGVYNRIVRDYNGGKPLSFKMTTYADAPAGSGLGTSSTLVVVMLKAFEEWLNLSFGEYDLASLAYSIEREDLKLSGGKQDQYAASFGGVNFIEFYDNSRVIVNPLRIKNWVQSELESSLLLNYLGQSRQSSEIINDQQKNVEAGIESSIEAMHFLKSSAFSMKEAVLKGDFEGFARCLRRGWEAKVKTSSVITNPGINDRYDFIIDNGGKAAKISGAGGGGFLMVFCDPIKRAALKQKLSAFPGWVTTIRLTNEGAESWKVSG